MGNARTTLHFNLQSFIFCFTPKLQNLTWFTSDFNILVVWCPPCHSRSWMSWNDLGEGSGAPWVGVLTVTTRRRTHCTFLLAAIRF